METLELLYVGGGILLTALSIPLILRRVKPNWWYGFRVRATLQNDQVWYDANCYAGKWLLGTGLVTIAAALLFANIPGISVDNYPLACLAVFGVAITLSIWQSFRYLHRITHA